MLRKTVILLATAAALTGGLTADAFARSGGGGGGGGQGGGFGGGARIGGGFGGGAHWAGSAAALFWAAALVGAISAVLAWLSVAALRVITLPRRAAASAAISIWVAGVSRRVGEGRTDTMTTAAIMIRRLSRPTSSPPIRPRITLRPLSLPPPPAPNAYVVFNPHSGNAERRTRPVAPWRAIGEVPAAEENFALAFLAPDLVKAAVQKRLPCGIGVTRLREAPAADYPPRSRAVAHGWNFRERSNEGVRSLMPAEVAIAKSLAPSRRRSGARPALRERGSRLFCVTTVSIVCTIKAPVPVRAEDGLYPPYLHGR